MYKTNQRLAGVILCNDMQEGGDGGIMKIRGACRGQTDVRILKLKIIFYTVRRPQEIFKLSNHGRTLELGYYGCVTFLDCFLPSE